MPPAAPASARAPKAAPKPVGEAAKPRVARPPQTPAEQLAASREKLRQLDPNHPELKEQKRSNPVTALAKVRRAIRDSLLRIYGLRGHTFEDCVRKKYHLGEKNYDKVFSREGASIPDALSATELVEIKGPAYVTMTRQLRIQAAAAKALRLKAVMYVREGTKVSACVNRHFKVTPVPKSEC